VTFARPQLTEPQGRRKLERCLSEILSDERNGLGQRLRRLIEDLREEWRNIDQRVKAFDDELAQRLHNEEVPGIGVLTATALVAAVGNAQTFSCGRDLAAWLGLVPRQATTGGKPRLLRISKRGNGYLRMLLIHGARTALPGLAKKDTPLGRWVKALLARAHRNVVTVALANKLARIAWAVLARDRRYLAVQTADARISIMARANAQGPDTLPQTCLRPTRTNPLADRGRAIHSVHTPVPAGVNFAPAPSRARCHRARWCSR
jgi:transposase